MWSKYHIELRRQSWKHKAASNSSSEETITANSLFHESRAKQTGFPTKFCPMSFNIFSSILSPYCPLPFNSPPASVLLVKWQHVLWQVQYWWVRQHMATSGSLMLVEIPNEIFLLCLDTYIYNGLRHFVSLRHPTISWIPLKLVCSFRGADSCGAFINWQAQVDVENYV